MIGLAIVSPLARLGCLLPKSAAEQKHAEDHTQPLTMSLTRAWAPYVIVAALLVVTRLNELPFKSLLQSMHLQWTNILTSNISVSFMPLYLPGSLFIVTASFSIWLQKGRMRQLQTALNESAKMLLPSIIALGAAVPMVRIFLQSGVNGASLPAMPMALAELVAQYLSGVWLYIAPLVGALGSFIAGSATFSNLMFASFQQTLAIESGLDQLLVLALQMLGANAGNMIAVVNVVAAASVVGLHGREGEVIRYTLLPMFFLLLSRQYSCIATLGIAAINANN